MAILDSFLVLADFLCDLSTDWNKQFNNDAAKLNYTNGREKSF